VEIAAERGKSRHEKERRNGYKVARVSPGEADVSYKQRIVLIIGAIAFLYLLLTCPKISVVRGTYVIPPPDKKDVAKIVDVSTAMTRAVAVLGATMLVFIALKDRKPTQTQSSGMKEPDLGGHGEENEGQLTGENVIAKVLRFLKDFF
jgi:hypothetical protein